MAVGHSILIIFYHLMTTGELYHEKDVDSFHYQDSGKGERQLVRRLEQLGYQVTAPPAASSDYSQRNGRSFNQEQLVLGEFFSFSPTVFR